MKKGDICLINLEAGLGHEQYGQRPAILVSNINSGIVSVIPLTSNMEALRFPFALAILPSQQNKLQTESVALVFHFKSIDQSRIIKVVGQTDRKSVV